MTDLFQICVFVRPFSESQFSEENLKNVRKRSRSDPESNPVPSLPSLPPPSASNPTGLIPSQQIGSPELSYDSELETKAHRNNLVAEEVTLSFSKLKKQFYEKNEHCVYVVYARRSFFRTQKVVQLRNVALLGPLR